ncbi:LLM class flavin-dependent oxidoreductase [Robertkochia solimangrovi]|uniref:LLM class flavin-dependent oxidoreductase n=1 Tax=Robertkochia solimangrovi TaxID=2213046 RepID=UPI00117CC790|nr:LLM class flavin-dependent oxidoreductase [Robertkochia solimangrovi]TRZ41182.1 LLM class flavin-dependent oxidoreductase [Robertkochia solimangrovi]
MKNIPLSVLDLAIVVQGGDPADAIRRTVTLAQQVENLGYNRLWLAEHHNMEHVASSATSVLIGHVAGQTKHMRIGSGGIMLPNHSPLVIAEQFGTLESIYPGRIDLGLGRAPGTDQLTAYALRRNNMTAADRFPEDVKELQQYLSTDNHGAKVRAFPGEGLDIPLWILGSSTDSAYLAANYGLPYAFASHFAPAKLMDAIEIYRNNFKPSAQLEKPYVMACVNAIGADTDEEAEHLVTSLYRMFMGIITNNRSPLSPPAPLPEMFYHPEIQQMVRNMTLYTFTGNKESLKEKFEVFVEATGVDELMITSPIYDMDAKYKSFDLVKEVFETA